MDKEMLKPVIESLIFASEGAITLNNIVSVIEGAERNEVRAALNELIEEHRSRGGGFYIEEVAGGYQFRTNPEFSPWLKRLLKLGPQRLSRAALETLAIVAYKQPITRGELEAVRGVDSAGVLATLLDKRLIKITGRKETPGRPVVYGTTREFLEAFELKDLSSLPTLKEIEIPEEEYAPDEESEGEEAPGPHGPPGPPRREGGAEEGGQEEGAGGEGGEEGEGGESGGEERAEGGGEEGREASEADSHGGDNLPEEGRGDDPRGEGERQ